MKTNLIATMLCLSLVLIFSGCASKEVVYVPKKCLVDKPAQFYPYDCRKIKNDLGFMQCVAENHAKMMANYEMLEKAFDGCR